MILIVELLVLCSFSENKITAQDGSSYGNDWVYFLDEYNNAHYVNLSDYHLFFENNYNSFLPIHTVRFWLYTRKNLLVKEELFIDELSFSTHYMPDKPVTVVTHGWVSNGYDSETQCIKNALLYKHDYNIIIVDWSKISYEDYIRAAIKTSAVAKKIGKLILMLARKYDLKGRMVHLIGHSLGAHIVSLAAVFLKNHGLTPARVTGLDPARPFFEFPAMLPGISPEGASFVDIIHTDAGILGIYEPRGHADFYPNGGFFQPGCNSYNIFADICRHRTSYKYFVDSILFTKFKSLQCSSYLLYKLDFCDQNDVQYMGYYCRSNATGTYFLDTGLATN